jgi:hypothetical protein
VVRNDNTVTFKNLILQLPTTRERMHFVRCPVSVHQFPNANLGVSYQGRLLARYDATGGILSIPPKQGARREGAPLGQHKNAGRRGIALAGANPQSVVFRPRSHPQVRSSGRKTVSQAPRNPSTPKPNNAHIFNCL